MGRYILKPQTERFECLPEIEDLTMHLAEITRIPTVPHALIRFADGELNYITSHYIVYEMSLLHASFSCWLNYINFTFLPD